MTITVEEVISKVLQIPVNQVVDDLAFQQVQEWDSLQHVLLMTELETTFDVIIQSEHVPELYSVKRIRDFINKRTISDLNVTRQDKVRRGLNGIVYDNSSITYIDGDKGELRYRGYPVTDLVKHETFESICFLLWGGRLPSQEDLNSFSIALKGLRHINLATSSLIRQTAGQAPEVALRTIMSSGVLIQNNNARDIELSVIAKVPTIVANHYRVSHNNDPIAPNPALDHVSNFLFMLSGQMPSQEEARALEQLLIAQMDHGSNASTFAARVAASTQSDLVSSLVSALSTFIGPLHGGAIKEVMLMIREIRTPNNAKQYVLSKISSHQPIMGFGHRVYRTTDPRAKILEGVASSISDGKDSHHYLSILKALMVEMEPYRRHGMNPNVDFFAGVILSSLGIPIELYVPVFIIARTIGWIAHIREQSDNNILIRPRLNYVGEEKTYQRDCTEVSSL